MEAASHPRHEDRLARLRQYEILDTPREADFDEIVELASQICEAPISVVNLIDAERQWFKAEVGLGVRETPLETSLCSHAILESEFMEIPDTLSDDRTSDNPLCLDDQGLRFYAGFLLKSDDGMPLGTLCVLDTKPRRLSDSQRNALRILARQVMHQLDLRLALQRQELMRKEIDHRVKNSLQAIAAYVRLRRTRAEGEEARGLLASILTRIEAVAALHEQFYKSSDDDRIDLKALGRNMRDLTAEICPPGVSVDIEFDDVSVGGGTASALSIIVSEFIANSIKHAFHGRESGAIRITGEVRDAIYSVSCKDDGADSGGGLPVTGSQSGLGMRIIEASIAQLGGAASWQSGSSGTELRFSFRP
jgi:two-component sensor histidine kinase